MTIRHLKVFIAVADCGKMSAAANKLFIAQPTVSQTISEIESYYGIKLFERLSKKLYITEAGSKLLEYSRHITALFDEMERQLQLSSRNFSIKVGATLTVGTCIITDIVNRFEQLFPSCKVDVYIDNTRIIEDKIIKSQLDLAVVEGNITSSDIYQEPIIEDELVLICGGGHKFFNTNEITINELNNENFILREKGSGTRDTFEKSLSENGIAIYEKWICHSAEAIKNAVISGQGLSVISRRLVEREVNENKLHIININNVKLIRNFSLIYHKNKFISEPLKDFIAQCRAIKD